MAYGSHQSAKFAYCMRIVSVATSTSIRPAAAQDASRAPGSAIGVPKTRHARLQRRVAALMRYPRACGLHSSHQKCPRRLLRRCRPGEPLAAFRELPVRSQERTATPTARTLDQTLPARTEGRTRPRARRKRASRRPARGAHPRTSARVDGVHGLDIRGRQDGKGKAPRSTTDVEDVFVIGLAR